MAQDNANSFLRVNKAELEFDEGIDPYSEEVYRRGKDNLLRLCREGIMARDREPSFYLYRLTMDSRSQTGLVALASVDEYEQGKIKKHEHTRPEKVTDRANHIAYLEAQVGPVFTTFKHTDTVAAIFQKLTAVPPETDFVADDEVRHELWVVSGANEIDALVNTFAEIPELYIADGHHRTASASEVCRRYRQNAPNYTGSEPFNYFLSVIFPDCELRILAYNRVIRDLNGLTLAELLDKSSVKFDIEKSKKEVTPEMPHQFGLYCEGHWYKLSVKAGSFDHGSPAGSIDASILGENLVAPILGITDPKADKRIDFVGGIRGIQELVSLVDSGEYKIAFSLYPTSVQQLLSVADAGEVMPPKSTWFEPKLRSGMVVSLLTD